MKQIYTTTLRLNLADEDDRRPTSICNGWTKSYIALTARRLLPLSMIILNGRNGLQPIHIWKPVKRRTIFFGG